MHHLVLAVIALFLVTGANASSLSCKEHACLAVVDAGSTGSRLHVYSYDLDGNNPIHIDEIYSKKIEPGVALLNVSQAAVDSYLATLFAQAPEANIPVYFYATAGMRLLSPQKQKVIYEKIKLWFSSQSQWQLVDAKTITGTEEGLYGWLAANYGLGTLASTDKPLVGVMDTGGASVQIAFPITNTESVNSDDRVEFEVYGRHLQLYIHSFLGLGQNEVDHQFLDVADCFSNDYSLPNGGSAHGNWFTCEKQVTELINNVHHVDKSVKPVIESNPIPTWYVLGALGYMAQMPPFTFSNNEFTMHRLADTASRELCEKDWATLYAQYPTNDYLYSACLNTSYLYALVVDGYGLNKNQTIHYLSKDKTSDDWALGVVLHHL